MTAPAYARCNQADRMRSLPSTVTEARTSSGAGRCKMVLVLGAGWSIVLTEVDGSGPSRPTIFYLRPEEYRTPRQLA